MDWVGWPLARFVLLFVALAYLMIGIQVTMSHYRQNFHHRAMIAPVVLSPILLVFGLFTVWLDMDWVSATMTVLLWIAIAAGLVGFYFHFRGVGKRVGGYEGRNFLIGPPVVLPLIFSAVAVLGLVALASVD